MSRAPREYEGSTGRGVVEGMRCGGERQSPPTVACCVRAACVLRACCVRAACVLHACCVAARSHLVVVTRLVRVDLALLALVKVDAFEAGRRLRCQMVWKLWRRLPTPAGSSSSSGGGGGGSVGSRLGCWLGSSVRGLDALALRTFGRRGARGCISMAGAAWRLRCGRVATQRARTDGSSDCDAVRNVVMGGHRCGTSRRCGTGRRCGTSRRCGLWCERRRAAHGGCRAD